MSESPKPSVIPSRAPRARVSNHLRHLLTLGATSATLACWPLACDPLPPPAACRDTGSVLSSIEAQVTSMGAQQLEVTIRLRETSGGYGVKLTRTAITGGTASSGSAVGATISVEHVTPVSSSAVIQLTYSATCEGSAAKGIRVTLSPRAPDAGATDAGATDGGTPTQYDLTLSEL